MISSDRTPEDLRPDPNQSPSDTGTPESSGDETVAGGSERGSGASFTETRFIGPYRLLRKLGEGGMGQVWLAEQSGPLKRRVTLKLIKAGMYDDSLLQRFLSERQSLAIMNHPSIAKVFDAGATPQGEPYFVMEYVSGLPISSYCDLKRLKIRERLEIFVKVCEGVQHAHQKAIIHRDLKPANILVVDVDGKPTPRIIDFGLAKNVAPQLDGEGMFTQLGGYVGTPGFISPEQADSSLGDVDTRTDVYSLGAILYVLLTSSLPFDPAHWKKQPLHEIVRRLREEDPPTPSTKISSERNTQSAVAEARRIEPGQLVTLLRGDLDWVTLKALEKDRARRYGTPSELAADIQRYLQNRPVLARPASTAYRLSKYVARHRLGAAAGATLALLLAAFVVTQAVQLRRIERERDRADREASAAKNVSDFLTGLFRVSDPSKAQGNTITAREILDRGRTQIETSLAGQPEVQARLLQTMGEVYWLLGLYDSAQPLLEKALDTRRRVLGPEDPATLQSMDQLARTLERRGQYARAESLARQALDVRRGKSGPDHAETAASMGNLAAVLYSEGHFADAEVLLREMLITQRRILKPDDPEITRVLENLGLDLKGQGRFTEAEKLFREALDIQRRVLGPEHPLTLTSMTNLAHTVLQEGKQEEAENLLRQTLKIQQRILGPDHSDTLWSAHALASTLMEEGHYAEAEKLDRETLDIRRRALGAENPDTLGSMNSLAIDLDMQRRFEEGRKIYLEALEIRRRVLGPDHPDTANTKYNLACNAALSGHRDAAIAYLRDALDHGMSPADAAGLPRDADLQSLHGDPRFEAIAVGAQKIAPSARNQASPAAQAPN